MMGWYKPCFLCPSGKLGDASFMPSGLDACEKKSPVRCSRSLCLSLSLVLASFLWNLLVPGFSPLYLLYTSTPKPKWHTYCCITAYDPMHAIVLVFFTLKMRAFIGRRPAGLCSFFRS
eukprot:RCo020054